jgi:hypothetical protein
MARQRSAMRTSTFVFWTVPAGDLPIRWDEAVRRVTEKQRQEQQEQQQQEQEQEQDEQEQYEQEQREEGRRGEADRVA